MMRKASIVLMSAFVLAQSGCTTTRPRWQSPKPTAGRIAYHPICARFGPPLLGPAPGEGLVPAYLFRIESRPDRDEQILRKALDANGFAVGVGTATINGSRILFAVGRGRLKTQSTADRLYRLMCAIETKEIRLVHVRYNLPAEANRMN